MDLQIDLSGFDLNSLIRTDTQGLMAAIGSYLEAEATDAFSKESAPFGGPWAQLSPEYAKRKAADKKTRRDKILRQTGQLFDSMVVESDQQSVTLRTNRPVGQYSLGAIHQFGAPRRRIPARPFFPIDSQGEILAQARQEIDDLVNDFFAP